jgi:hypothetical protein
VERVVERTNSQASSNSNAPTLPKKNDPKNTLPSPQQNTAGMNAANCRKFKID